MGPADIAIIVIVAVIVVVAVVRLVGTTKGTRDCCSGAKKGAASGGRSFPAVEVADKDESHYPYAAELGIGGMSCERCVAAVTNALDSLEGAWATVELAGGHAHVRSKAPLTERVCRQVVEQAGYRLVSFRQVTGK